MGLARFLLWINGLAFVGTGLLGFFAFSGFAGFVEFELLSSAATTEFIANYGGLYLFYGLYLVYCGLNACRHVPGLVVLGFTSVGLFAGRLVGSVITMQIDATQLLFASWEIATGLLCMVALRTLKK